MELCPKCKTCLEVKGTRIRKNSGGEEETVLELSCRNPACPDYQKTWEEAPAPR